MKIPLAYLASMIEEVQPDLWAELFDAVGWPVSLKDKRQNLTHEDIFNALTQDDLTDESLLALEAVETLGTEQGRDAIAAAMRDQHVPLDRLPSTGGEREMALRLFLLQRDDAIFAEIFARAQIQIQEGSDRRRYNEYCAREARPVSRLNEKAKTVRAETLRYCAEQHLGDHVQVVAFEDDDYCVFRIVRSHHIRKPLAVVPGRAAHAPIEYRPVHVDLLRYDTSLGHLRIFARAASIVDFYRRMLGRVLFADESFFDGDPICSLRVLQERGRTALADHRVPGIGRVWMTECLWDLGDRERLLIKGRDCFESIERLGTSPVEGQFLQAKLKMEVVRKSSRPVTVTVRVPSRIEVSPRPFEALVDRFLTAIGIRRPVVATVRADLWSLHPWRHTTAVWRELFGRETDSLVHAGVLAPIQLAAIAHHEHGGAGRVLVAHELPNGGFYGVSQVPEIPSRTLSPTDLDGLELRPEALRLYLRTQMGIAEGGVTWDGSELLHLGFLLLDDHRLHVTYALRPLMPGAGARIQACAGAARSVVLMPCCQSDGSELPKVTLGKPLPVRDTVIRDAVAVCGLTDVVSPLYSAPDGSRLIVDTTRGRIWLDNVPVSGFSQDTHPFRFVEMLVRKSPSAISSKDMCTHLSPYRSDDTTAARRAKNDATQLMRKAMNAAGKPFVDPFVTEKGAYRCVLPSHVV
jgi:hypothetical protein